MLEIASSTRRPRTRRPPAPPDRWWWNLARWLLSIGEDEARGPSRFQPDTAVSAPAGGRGPAQPGSAEAVDLLYQEHARAVLAYLFYRLPTLQDAEDALDDVFVAALNACASGQTLTGGWLMVTAQRRVVDFYRRSQRALPLTATGAAHDQRASESSEPEWVALQGETRRRLLRLIARLPEDQQEALALRFAAGMSSPEIGEVVGKRADAVRALLARAMRRLREEWER